MIFGRKSMYTVRMKNSVYKFWDGKLYHMELIKKSEKKNQKSVFLTGESHPCHESDEFRTIHTVSVLLSTLCRLFRAAVWSVHLTFLPDCVFTSSAFHNLIHYLIKIYFIQHLLIWESSYKHEKKNIERNWRRKS